MKKVKQWGGKGGKMREETKKCIVSILPLHSGTK